MFCLLTLLLPWSTAHWIAVGLAVVQGPGQWFLGISVKHRHVKTSMTEYAAQQISPTSVYMFTLMQSCALSYVHLPVPVSRFLGSEASSGLWSSWECVPYHRILQEKEDPQDLPRAPCWVVPSAAAGARVLCVLHRLCRCVLLYWPRASRRGRLKMALAAEPSSPGCVC